MTLSCFDPDIVENQLQTLSGNWFPFSTTVGCMSKLSTYLAVKTVLMESAALYDAEKVFGIDDKQIYFAFVERKLPII